MKHSMGYLHIFNSSDPVVITTMIVSHRGNSSVDREWKNMEVFVEVNAFYSDFQGELLLLSATSMQRMSIKGSSIKSGFTGLKYSSLLNLVHLTGSLKEHLNVTLDPLKAPLDWKTRLKIVVGVNNTILARPLPIIDERPTIIFGMDVTHHRNRGGLKLFNSRGFMKKLGYPDVEIIHATICGTSRAELLGSLSGDTVKPNDPHQQIQSQLTNFFTFLSMQGFFIGWWLNNTNIDMLKFRVYSAAKRTTSIHVRGSCGPLISAISVDLSFMKKLGYPDVEIIHATIYGTSRAKLLGSLSGDTVKPNDPHQQIQSQLTNFFTFLSMQGFFIALDLFFLIERDSKSYPLAFALSPLLAQLTLLQIESLEREIEENRRQMRALEKQIIEINEASISNTSLANMKQIESLEHENEIEDSKDCFLCWTFKFGIELNETCIHSFNLRVSLLTTFNDILNIDIQSGDLKHFQRHWSEGQLVIVSNVHETTLGLSWEPMVMWRDFHQITKVNHDLLLNVSALNCLEWFETKNEMVTVLFLVLVVVSLIWQRLGPVVTHKSSASGGYRQTRSQSLGKGPVVHYPGDENVIATNGGAEGWYRFFGRSSLICPINHHKMHTWLLISLGNHKGNVNWPTFYNGRWYISNAKHVEVINGMGWEHFGNGSPWLTFWPGACNQPKGVGHLETRRRVDEQALEKEEENYFNESFLIIYNNAQGQFWLGAAVGSQSRAADKPTMPKVLASILMTFFIRYIQQAQQSYRCLSNPCGTQNICNILDDNNFSRLHRVLRIKFVQGRIYRDTDYGRIKFAITPKMAKVQAQLML
ncbi:zinc finger, ZZ-type, JmjC domain-containing protein [Artemisia annua]|uniref:Zinc finger, ZZ-type, JmjC domain-containing protein n=1 Tax=Artemisia annua TaxID=35608 RepID=A0A2U1P3E4_ARTAN|nr:zinc finger, ZZ-type, JmjC domain-containing protein [Artemisia annua]